MTWDLGDSAIPVITLHYLRYCGVLLAHYQLSGMVFDISVTKYLYLLYSLIFLRKPDLAVLNTLIVLTIYLGEVCS